MNISLTGRHVELTEPIKDHMKSSIDTLNKYNLDIISVSAVASTEERKGKRGVSIEFTINLAGKNTIVIKQRDDDLYAAIDIAIDRAQKALRRLNDRSTDYGGDTLNEAKNESAGPAEMSLHKPREIADVLEELRESPNKQFEVFNDLEGKTRVLYKRSDGKFGLY